MGLPAGQLALLHVVLGVGWSLIALTVDQAALAAAALLGVSAVGGLCLCRGVQFRLRDPSLRILGYLWLLKVAATIAILRVGWADYLDHYVSVVWEGGYDPARYYLEAKELLDNGWQVGAHGLNHVGILYYYAAIYYVVGYNPIIPALVNASVTLIATLYLLTTAYAIKQQRARLDWTLGLVLLTPEIVYFDVLTSRETLLSALLVMGLCSAGRYLVSEGAKSAWRIIGVIGVSAFGIAAVRPPVLLVLISGITVMVVLLRGRQRRENTRSVVLATVATGVISAAIYGGSGLGAFWSDVAQGLEQATVSGEAFGWNDAFHWNERSIGLLLVPRGWLDAVLLLPVRAVLYLIAPLPAVAVSIDELIAGNSWAWQELIFALSAIMNIALVPYALAGLRDALARGSRNRASIVIHISYWISLAAIAGGNVIIHERYRVMATPFLVASAWLGWISCRRALVRRAAVAWCAVLCAGAAFYVGYKFLIL